MKRTTLRTSAIALGVAAAMPATAQEWNLKWGGMMNQHVVFGSTDKKTTVSVNDLSMTLSGNRVDTEPGDGEDRTAFEAGKYTAEILFVESVTPEITAAAGASPNVFVLPVAAGGLDTLGEIGGALADADTSTTGNKITAYLPITATAITDGEVTNGVFTELHKQIAAVNSSVDMSGNGQRRNTEVHFKPSVTLENGITFAAQIELEADSAGVDRSYMEISSDSLGKITLGSHPSMGYGMIVAAPGVGLGINSGAHPNFIPVGSQTGAAYSSNNEVGGNWEAMRVSYMTPSLGGLTIGVSYAADGRGNGNSANHTGYLLNDPSGPMRRNNGTLKSGDLSDIMDIGASFTQSMGEINFTLAARYGTGKQEGYDKKPRESAIGAQVGFGSFKIGGAYADSQRPAGKDSEGWSLGASFKPNEAWTFGIETYQGEYDNGDDHSVSKIAASRNLGPGVDWDIYAITAESTTTQGSLVVGYKSSQTAVSGVRDGREGTAGTRLTSSGKTEGSGTIFGTAIKLKF
ncbi:MAG: porin [Roseovarius sp.]|nr:porin [Roseovarius sp.]